MNNALKVLYALQQVDSALLLCDRQYRALDSGKAEQAAAETGRELLARLVRATQETARDLQAAELELKGVEEKKKDRETRLYGGKISGAKEMMDTEKEIESLGRHRGLLDEKILTLMDQLETRRAEEAAAQARLAILEAALAEKQKAYQAEERKLRGQSKALREVRAQRLSAVTSAPLLKRYDAIRASKDGVGIAKIVGENCGSCHTQLPTNTIRSLEDTDTIETCQNCGRILCII